MGKGCVVSHTHRAGDNGRAVFLTYMKRIGGSPALAAFGAMMVVALSACEEQLPVSIEGGDLPGQPITIQVEIPWSEFASNLEVFGGYGSPEDLGQGVLANAFAGTLNARTLLRVGAYPQVATARDSTGTLRPDSSLVYMSGRLVAFFDTLNSTNFPALTPVALSLGATQAEWDPTTVSWAFAVDTINDQRAWAEAGAGPITAFSTATWDPAMGDSAVFLLDSAQVAAWSDTTDVTRGVRIDMVDTGERLRVRDAALRLDARPGIDPDTILDLSTDVRNVTFIYDPFPSPPPDGVRIGGSPSWRTVLDVSIPEQLTGPAAFCAVVSCPHVLEPAQISSATIVLTSRSVDPAFQPTDSVRLDVRSVFDRSAMPKSPLGPSLVADFLGKGVSANAFGAGAGEEVEIPFTSFARDLVRGEDADGNPPASTLALLSVFEPLSITFASFEGPGGAGEPVLRLILTIGPTVELP